MTHTVIKIDKRRSNVISKFEANILLNCTILLVFLLNWEEGKSELKSGPSYVSQDELH